MTKMECGVLDRFSSICKDIGVTELAWRAFSFGYKKAIRPCMPRGDEIFYSG